MIDWPGTLINEIVKERCVLFLGAGVSASAIDPRGNRLPEWKGFLQEACGLVHNAGQRSDCEALIRENKLLIALQAIKDLANPAEYHSFLDRHYNNRRYAPSELHRIIYELDARIVVTTNFDKIYETYCFSFAGGDNAFKVIDYTARGLADELRSDTRLIIKAHGTIDRIDEMIFTRAEYHAAKRDQPQFYDVLRSIFITSTIVFVGCGLEDPDIMLLLEDVKITGRQSKPHYALVLKGRHEFLIKDWRATYNIHVMEYEPDHAALVLELNNLLNAVEVGRAEFSGAARPGV